MIRTRQPQNPSPLASQYRCGALTLFVGDSVDWLGASMVSTMSANLLSEVSSAGRGWLYQNNTQTWYYPSLQSKLTGAKQLTIAAVLRKQNAGNGFHPFDSWNNTANPQVNYEITTAGAIQFGVYKDASNVLIKKSADGVIQTGKTHCVVVGWDGSALTCFVDGLSVALGTSIWVAGTVDQLSTQAGNVSVCWEMTWGAGALALLGSWVSYLPNQQTLSANPWQLFAPPRRIWVQLAPAAGGTTTDATLSATVTAGASFTSMKVKLLELLATLAQAVALPRAISVTRSAASALTTTAARQISTLLSASKSATATALLQINLLRTVSAATTATAARQIAAIRSAAATVTATTARHINALRSATTTAVATALRAVGTILSTARSAVASIIADYLPGGGTLNYKTLTASVAQTATVQRAVDAVRSVALTTSATYLRALTVTRAAAATVAPVAVKAVSTMRSAATTAVAVLTSIKVKLQELTASIATGAVLARSVLSVREAAVTATATLWRALTVTLATATTAGAATTKAVSKTVAASLVTVASFIQSIFNGAFWSTDRTFTIAAAPRSYAVAAAPRVFVVQPSP